MKMIENTGYKKGVQKDYSLSFKLRIVQEIELGEITGLKYVVIWY